MESPCEKAEATSAYALEALGVRETEEAEAHIASCPECRQALKKIRALVERFACWPADMLRPEPSLKARLAFRIAEETGKKVVLRPVRAAMQAEWEDVAPGIACKLLATDRERDKVSMLVRLAPGARYPSHVHAGTEELYLLDGELWIGGRKLVAGDFHCSGAGACGDRVFSETGCTCFLVTGTQGHSRRAMNHLDHSAESFGASAPAESAALRIDFECRHCASKGWLIWAQPSGLGSRRIAAGVEALSDGFYMRMDRAHRGGVEIMCGTCGRPQQEIIRRIRGETSLPRSPGTGSASDP